jgi:hypothetical protein
MLAQATGPNFNGVLRHAIIHDPGDLVPRFQRTWAGIVGCDLWIAVIGLRARATQAGSRFYTIGNNAPSLQVSIQWQSCRCCYGNRKAWK